MPPVSRIALGLLPKLFSKMHSLFYAYAIDDVKKFGHLKF